MSALHELKKKGKTLKFYLAGLEREGIKGWVVFSQRQEEKTLNPSVKIKRKMKLTNTDQLNVNVAH